MNSLKLIALWMSQQRTQRSAQKYDDVYISFSSWCGTYMEDAVLFFWFIVKPQLTDIICHIILRSSKILHFLCNIDVICIHPLVEIDVVDEILLSIRKNK